MDALSQAEDCIAAELARQAAIALWKLQQKRAATASCTSGRGLPETQTLAEVSQGGRPGRGSLATVQAIDCIQATNYNLNPERGC